MTSLVAMLGCTEGIMTQLSLATGRLEPGRAIVDSPVIGCYGWADGRGSRSGSRIRDLQLANHVTMLSLAVTGLVLWYRLVGNER